MSTWNRYYLAHSIEDAIETLSNCPGPTCPVGGGTDLLLELQQGHHSPIHTLVDITRIPDLNRLEETGDELYIGAAVPVCQVTESPLVREHALAVAEACGLIGGPQVRNSATLGGNVAHALPAADGMIGLLAMGAEAEIASPAGRRRQPILSLFKGPGQSTLVPGQEILVGFYLPLRPATSSLHATASAFSRVMRPQGVALPILNLAVWLEREEDCIRDIRIAIGPAGPTPRRAIEVEECLKGAAYSPVTLAEARDVWEHTLRFRTSPRRATAEYRQHLGKVLFEKVIDTAWKRAYPVAAEIPVG